MTVFSETTNNQRSNGDQIDWDWRLTGTTTTCGRAGWRYGYVNTIWERCLDLGTAEPERDDAIHCWALGTGNFFFSSTFAHARAL